jgi:hypothetical protein
MKGNRRRLLSLALTLGVIVPCARADENFRVYFIGNSLTRNVPLERLQMLFESRGIAYEYGMQLGGGHRLAQHLSKRNHGNKPGEGKYNIVQSFGEYDRAFKNFTFDAVVLQPYMSELDKPVRITPRWPHFSCGDLQAASSLIDYARGMTPLGSGRWDYDNPNRENKACEQFYIYATWPKAEDILAQPDEKTYAAYYARAYSGGVQPCADYSQQLVNRLNEKHADLSIPVRLIPAGQVLAAIDIKIRDGKLPGINEFYERNQAYFIKSRRNNKKPSPFDPEKFDPSAGVLNFYADGVHMNDQPHNGDDSGAIGSYVAALTIFATLTGHSPVGLTAAPYEQFDEKTDGDLVKALQETVWEVVSGQEQP